MTSNLKTDQEIEDMTNEDFKSYVYGLSEDDVARLTIRLLTNKMKITSKGIQRVVSLVLTGMDKNVPEQEKSALLEAMTEMITFAAMFSIVTGTDS